MATGRDSSTWSGTNQIRRDFRQDHGGGQEEIKGHPKRKRDKRWCRGKVDREHRWEYKVIYSWTNSKGDVFEQKRWVCQLCGKQEYVLPRSPLPPHKHDYSGTKIEENWWDSQDWLYEVCIICGKLGKHIKV